MKYITIAGSDPGKNNSAMSIVKVSLEDVNSFKIVETFMVDDVIKDLTANPFKQAAAYRRAMQRKIKQHGVDVFVVERFQNRGRFSGNTGELVSMGIGVLYGLPILDVMVITAAQWKNAFNREGDLNQLYKDSLLVPHRVDSTSIALYGAAQYLGVPPFTFLRDGGQRRFCKRLNKTI